MNDDDERKLEIAGRILDGQPVAWDTMPGESPPDDVSQDAWRVIADVAELHRAPTGEAVRRWGTLAIQEQIGHGTFGDVYRARDAALDRDVALKLVEYAPSATAPDEGRLLARLRHSNVVTVYGAAIHDGRYGIWMEFIRGRTLAAVVRKHGPLAPEEVTAIGIDVCRALTAVHASGLLHGDIKPQNVMREEGGRIVVMDFGTGRVLKDGAGGDRLAGTPLYLAPEVLTGAAPDVRADVYSAGVLLYYLLTGSHPVEGSTLDEVRAAHAYRARAPLRSRRPEIPRPLAAIIERAIAIKPSDRFETAADLERALRESFAPRARLFTKRLAAVIAISGLAAGLLIGAFALFAPQKHLWHADGASPTEPMHRQITFLGDVYAPTISRNGKFLAYLRETPNTKQATVFVQNLSGGQPLPVFSGEHLTQVVWSHDGSELLVSQDGWATIVPRLGGQARRVGPPKLLRPSWSPDDARFAGVMLGIREILLVDKRTGLMRNIPLTGSFESVTGVDWSPMGDLFLFETRDAQGRDAIWTIRVDGSHQEKVIAESTLGLGFASWAPKGDAIYYFRGTELRDLMKVPVSDRTGKATGSPQVVMAGLQAGPEFTISGDGQQLVYTREIGRANLWLAPMKRSGGDAPDVTRLTSGTTSDESPSISPDGRLIAFVRFDRQNESNIFVIPVDGGTPEQITFRNSVNLSPVWSPDGGTIAYTSYKDGQPEVWLVSRTRSQRYVMPDQLPVWIEGRWGAPRALGQTVGVVASWAPNSNIVYREFVSGRYQLLNPTTGEQKPLVEDSSSQDMGKPVTSPDSTQVAVSRSWPTGLWLVPLQRTSEAALLASGSSVTGTISQTVDASTHRGRDVTLVAHIKTSSGPGSQSLCWLRVLGPNGRWGFNDFMSDRPIRPATWKELTISGRVDRNAEQLAFGCELDGTGQMWVDDVQLRWKNSAGNWEIVPINNPGFEEGDDRMKPRGWTAKSPGYLYQITDASPYSGRHCLTIKSTYIYGDFYPLGWSADGKSVYADNADRGTQIVMIRTDGGGLHPVIDLRPPEGFSIGHLAMTSAGQRVVYEARLRQSDVWIARNFDPGR